MKFNIVDVEHRYREMADEELLAIAPRDLTREARTCYAKEMARRELAVEIPEEASAGEHPQVPVIRGGRGVNSYLREADKRADKWLFARCSIYFLFFLVGRLTTKLVPLNVIAGCWFVCVIAAEILLPRAFRGRAPILWLRKFRPRSLRGFKFETCLFDACNCLGTPFTIQDQSYSYSSAISMGLRAILLPAFLVLALLAVQLAPNLLPGYGNQSVFYFFALVIAGMVVLYVSIPRWFGVKRVIDTGTGEQLNAQIQKIKRGHVAGVTAAVVLRCSPASWRTVVKKAQEFAALVVIDVTDLSENVLWELETAVSLKEPQMIVLAHRIEAGNTWALPPLCVKQIRDHVGSRTLEAMPVFLYPASEDQLSDLEQSPSDALRHIVARALLQSNSAKPLPVA